MALKHVLLIGAAALGLCGCKPHLPTPGAKTAGAVAEVKGPPPPPCDCAATFHPAPAHPAPVQIDKGGVSPRPALAGGYAPPRVRTPAPRWVAVHHVARRSGGPSHWAAGEDAYRYDQRDESGLTGAPPSPSVSQGDYPSGGRAGSQSYSQQSYSQQSYSQQSYSQQSYSRQGYSEQADSQQGYDDGGYDSQGGASGAQVYSVSRPARGDAARSRAWERTHCPR
jgi:hypothetical protein